MLVGIDTYKSLIKAFIMPTIKKIFNDHSRVISGFAICADEGVGEVVLILNDIPVYVNIQRGIIGDDSKHDIIYNEAIDALTEMGFNRENLSFGYDTISFRNFEFHRKLLNKNEDI